MTKFEERVNYYKEKQLEMCKLSDELQKKKHEYKAEMKAEFGVCDSEPAEVLSLLAAVKKVIEIG